ncbi:MAG: RecX family transcriptional regulator [Clostridia bacterium]|nr:RecX family transcriptional regulator [Clostridia bacterium]
MKITKIEVQKKNKNRVNLYVDEEFFCGLSLETVVKNHLKEGIEVEEDKLNFLIFETEKEMALSKAVNYISKCQKTKKEVFKYLLQKGYDEQIVNYAISKLEEYNFVDDILYAKNYIKFKNKNNGSRKIEMELKQKGISEEIAKESLETYSNDREYVLSIAIKYMKNKDKDIKTKQKAYRHLASRGFNSDDIIYALNQIFKNNNEEDF